MPSPLAATTLSRRKARLRQEYVDINLKIACKAKWEQKSIERYQRASHTLNIQSNSLETACSFFNSSIEQQLRRHNLIRNLYEKEMKEWKEQITNSMISNELSIESKIEKIRLKAHDLKTSREERRQSFAKECYDRQWRDSCDEARTYNSKAITEKLLCDRKKSLTDKKRSNSNGQNKELEEEEEKMIKKQIRESKQRELIEISEKTQKNKEMKQVLDEQVKFLKQKKANDKTQKKNAEMKQILSWRQEEERRKREEHKLKEDAYQQGEKVLQFNSLRSEIRKQNVTLQKDRDLILLSHEIKQEQDKIKEEEKNKHYEKEVSKQYQTYLQKQLEKDKKDSSMIDRIRKQENDKYWNQYDINQQAQVNIRKELMMQITKDRQDQIQEKNYALQDEKGTLQEWVQSTISKNIQLEKEEQQKLKSEKSYEKEIAQVNRILMNSKLQKKKLDKQQDYLENKQCLYVEEQRQEKLKELISNNNVKTYFPLKQTKWYS